METEKKILISYSSNNSGGSWWLKDEDWQALEKAGWQVEWAKNKTQIFTSDKDERWLGALATSASKEFASIKDAILEFEKVTGQSASDEGCNCCGAPHSFSWEGGYCSGDDCLSYLYDRVPRSLREACEEIN